MGFVAAAVFSLILTATASPLHDIQLIAFSKDRPAQLDLLLQSLSAHAPRDDDDDADTDAAAVAARPVHIKVIAAAGSPDFARGYRRVQRNVRRKCMYVFVSITLTQKY